MSSTERTVLVTGANGGLGSAIVTNLLQKPELAGNYTGLYTVRKAASATRLQGILKQAPESHKNVLDMDLSSLASLRTAAAEINRRVAAGELPPIKVLILNAAYQDHEQITMTDDGYETTWQVNFLANQLLALLLLQSMDKEKSRILIIGSWSHDIDDERNNLGGQACYQGYDSLFPGPDELARGKWSRPDTGGGWLTGFRRYGASKLCAVMLMHELVNRLAQDPQLSNITVTGLDPGAMASDLVRRGSFLMYQTIKLALPIISPLLVRFSPNGPYRPLYKSAEDAVQLAFEREAPKGRLLYLNGTDELETGKEARDDAKRKALWTYALQAADIKREDTILQDWQ